MSTLEDPQSIGLSRTSPLRSRTSSRRPRLLIADDEADLRYLLGVVFEGLGWEVDEAADGLEALDKLVHQSYDLVFLDQRMPRQTGAEVFDKLRALGIAAPVILITAATTAADIARTHGIDNYLGKPFGMDDLLQIVKALPGSA